MTTLSQLLPPPQGPSTDTMTINVLSSGVRDAIAINIQLQILQTLQSIEATLVSGGGGGGTAAQQVSAGNYAGNPPSFTPTTTSALAVDTSTGALWSYANGTWTALIAP